LKQTSPAIDVTLALSDATISSKSISFTKALVPGAEYTITYPEALVKDAAGNGVDKLDATSAKKFKVAASDPVLKVLGALDPSFGSTSTRAVPGAEGNTLRLGFTEPIKAGAGGGKIKVVEGTGDAGSEKYTGTPDEYTGSVLSTDDTIMEFKTVKLVAGKKYEVTTVATAFSSTSVPPVDVPAIAPGAWKFTVDPFEKKEKVKSSWELYLGPATGKPLTELLATTYTTMTGRPSTSAKADKYCTQTTSASVGGGGVVSVEGSEVAMVAGGVVEATMASVFSTPASAGWTDLEDNTQEAVNAMVTDCSKKDCAVEVTKVEAAVVTAPAGRRLADTDTGFKVHYTVTISTDVSELLAKKDTPTTFKGILEGDDGKKAFREKLLEEVKASFPDIPSASKAAAGTATVEQCNAENNFCAPTTTTTTTPPATTNTNTNTTTERVESEVTGARKSSVLSALIAGCLALFL